MRTASRRTTSRILLIVLSAVAGGVPAAGQQATVLLDSARVAVQRGEQRTAEVLYAAGLAEFGRIGTQPDLLWAELLYGLGGSLRAQHLNDTAWVRVSARMLADAIVLRERICGSNDSTLLDWKCTMGQILLRHEWMSEALGYLEDVLDVCTREGSVPSLFTTAAMRHKADLLARGSRFKEAEEWYRRAIEYTERHFPDQLVFLADANNRLADINSEQGKYQEAEVLARRAVTAYASSPIPRRRMGWFLTYLGEAVDGLGRRAEAEALYREAVDQCLLMEEPDSTLALTPLGDLGRLYHRLGRLQEAEHFMSLSLQLNLAGSWDGDIEVARRRIYLGNIYVSQGRYDEADTLIQKGLRVRIHTYGEDNLLVGRGYSTLANLRLAQNRHVEAEQYWLRALAIAEKAFAADNNDAPQIRTNLGTLYAAMGRLPEAETHFNQARGMVLRNIYRNLPSFSDRERAQYLAISTEFFERYNSFLLGRSTSSPGAAATILENQLATKALLLASTREIRRSIVESGDSTVRALFTEWLELRAHINAKTLWKPDASAKGRANLAAMHEAANSIERRLTLLSGGFARLVNTSGRTFESVRSSLAPREAVVELLRIHKYASRRTDSVLYAALIVRQDRRAGPELVLLDDGRDLETASFARYRRAIAPFDTPGLLNDIDRYTRELPGHLVALYNRYWAPVQRRLQGIRSVYVAPDGVYHKINLATLMPDSATFLMQRIQLRLLTSARDLVNTSARAPLRSTVQDALIVGRPDYDFHSQESGDRKESGIDSLAAATEHARAIVPANLWKDLPGSEMEARGIAQLLAARGWHSDTLIGGYASEASVKKATSKALLHFSTHGYFTDVPERAASAGVEATSADVSDDPLLHSGLVLCGANSTTTMAKRADWEGLASNADDGILTAAEACDLRLENARLVVLSGCETGLGAVQNGEGVFGLQRAFIIAGARSVMMSLWSVEETATKTLMELFYKNWLECGDAHRALRDAQKSMLRKGYLALEWGAFVIIGGA